MTLLIRRSPIRWAACWCIAFAFPSLLRAEVTIVAHDDRATIEIDGKLFTEYVFGRGENPYLYPVIGPYGIPVTRDYPMRVVAGEAHDHPHHTSMWFAHDGLNGVDFWRSAKPGHGVVRHDRIASMSSGADRATLHTANRWLASDGSIVCRDERQLTFLHLPSGRAIDWLITLTASEGELKIMDTEEGTMAIRTHANLQLIDKGGTTTANGRALNSEGVRDKDVWGKRAKWIDYWGTIGGRTVGVAIFDHPQNLRHPTWWMARDYGLVAANPFGIHDFEGKPPGTGDFTLKRGESLTLRYRFLFHAGSPDEISLPDEFAKFQTDPVAEPLAAGASR